MSDGDDDGEEIAVRKGGGFLEECAYSIQGCDVGNKKCTGAHHDCCLSKRDFNLLIPEPVHQYRYELQRL